MSPQTSLQRFKSGWYRGRCSALHPFSLTFSPNAITTVIPPFLAEKQTTMQMLVFQAQNKCNCFVTEKCAFLILHCVTEAYEYRSQTA